ncbi:MAG: FAD-dependent monooxygenase [Myxococcales bacterium]|nr:FAD-dependent monooxygenase [Myxococcales bacterium]
MSDVSAVLVVGAGPTGLVLGTELARRGVRVRVVDKAPEASKLSRAIVLHARTLEILDSLGIVGELLRSGHQLGGARLYSGERLVVSASFDELDTRFPFALAIPQYETERHLEWALQSHGVKVERGVELTDLVQLDDRVRATLRLADGSTETVEAAYAVGCDGAHSLVRKKVGLEFEGEQFPEGFFLADVRLRAPAIPREFITTYFTEEGMLACFPMPDDRFRLIATSPVEKDGALTLEELQECLDRRAPGGAIAFDPAWLARFRVHSRQVSAYRKDRVFLAGDAAHIHSPAGGQGMNTGIQDAHNLGWKLALVIGGHAHDVLLDSYHAERHQVGAALLRSTELATRVGTFKSPVARAVRDRIAHFMSSLEVVQQRIMRSIAELDLDYKASPIVENFQESLFTARVGDEAAGEGPTIRAWREFHAAPHAGARAPDATCLLDGKETRLSALFGGGAHTLLLFDGRAATEHGYDNLARIAAVVHAQHGDRVRVHVVVPRAVRPSSLPGDLSVLLDPEGEVEHRYGAACECAYLIRPDLYVGFRMQPAVPERLVRYLEQTLRLR